MDLTNPIFQHEDKAREHLEATRWPHGPICPHCGVVDEATYVGGKAARKGVYQCNACRDQFSVTVGTVFESSKVPLNKWLLATYLMSSSKKGISAHQLHRTLGVTYKTAWFMAHRIREAMNPTDPAPLGCKGKVVEADETYVGAKEHNKHASKRKEGGGPWNKAAVVTLVERQGRARSVHVANVTSKTLGRVVRTTASRASHLMTDGAKQYRDVGREFASHASVDHTAGEYVRLGFHHSNTVENYFSILKRGVIGTFHHVSEQYLARYLAEFDFRYSLRSGLGVDDEQRTDELLRNVAGKRLTYRRADKAA
ncbi:IS1595 family transposase [Phenylobacterium sp.]|uniref:IS1595 family transposase n=1 Tax=Phenylobacterium sp. TaxID=1871053 RepID=UPI0025F29AAF|nr:IS1595 family transposase [Phenylobacterium sp.]MBX3484801.1 IS1595 family transposase [Phenylobacterium sp.]MCW5759078.1 IS1595 family transposase [Phenylobacterium sp.]